MPVYARQFIKKMRGGAQAHLIEASDDLFYVVKFLNNPQHRRILINEWIANAVFQYLKIQTPEISIVEFSQEFLDQNPEVHIQLGFKKEQPPPTWHFASRYPGHPHRMAVYDFLPDTLLSNIHNLHEFIAAFVIDKWLGNTDTRQAIFFRAQIRDFVPESSEHPLKKSFIAQMIDHGYVLNGPHWGFQDAPQQGMYFRSLVYQQVRSMNDFEPWLTQIAGFPIEIMDESLRSLPPAWVADDMVPLESILEKLWRRRESVPELILQTWKSSSNPFQNWTR